MAQPTTRRADIKCPYCYRPGARRSQRRGVIDNFLAWLGWYPFRCRCCDRRFFSRRFHGQETEAQIEPSSATPGG